VVNFSLSGADKGGQLSSEHDRSKWSTFSLAFTPPPSLEMG
jgi:hypothetical protein